MKCPSCHKILVKEKLKNTEIDRCPACSGLWLDQGELDRLTESGKRKMEYNITAYDAGIHGDKYPERDCPLCGKAMKKVALPQDKSIILDFCTSCRGFWLDKDELKASISLLKKKKDPANLIYDPIMVYLKMLSEEPHLF
ncbi:MAG: zf-TFIIB domain-containing protein [Spirochaetales bacterium]|nr:zf-TFIIB domain-containing protein [Spirochaetales bacterium]